MERGGLIAEKIMLGRLPAPASKTGKLGRQPATSAGAGSLRDNSAKNKNGLMPGDSDGGDGQAATRGSRGKEKDTGGASGQSGAAATHQATHHRDIEITSRKIFDPRPGGCRLADGLDCGTGPRARTGGGKGGENRQETGLADGGLDNLTVRANGTTNAHNLPGRLDAGNNLGKGEEIGSKRAGTAEMDLRHRAPHLTLTSRPKEEGNETRTRKPKTKAAKAKRQPARNQPRRANWKPHQGPGPKAGRPKTPRERAAGKRKETEEGTEEKRGDMGHDLSLN